MQDPAHPWIARLVGADLGYDRRNPVVRGVDFTLHAGDFWCFVGPNGGGKTTLLRTLMHLLPVLGGRLDRDDAALDPRRTGYIPQHFPDGAAMPVTVREFVDLGLAGLRLSRRDAADRVARTLDSAGLAPLARRDLSALSGGQRQRALLARALVRDPSVLFVDEPTTGLDLPAQREFLDRLSAVHRERAMTVLLVLHDLGEAARLARHTALLSRGRMVLGETSAVLTPAHLQEAYGVPFRVTGEGAATAVMPA